MTYKIERGPIPAPTRRRYPFPDMRVKDYFEFPLSERPNISSAACKYGKKHRIEFTIYKVDDKRARCQRVQ